jgi:hypothetical protein
MDSARIIPREIRQRMLHELQQAKHIILVTHQKPDRDGGAAAFALIRKSGYIIDPQTQRHRKRNILDINLVCVPKGTRFSDPVDPGTLVIHLDTGGELDLENWILDHHYEGCPFHSTLDIVIALLWYQEDKNLPRYMQGIHAYVNRVDSGNRVGGMTPEDKAQVTQVRDFASSLVAEGERSPVSVKPNQPGPDWVEKIARNMPEYADDGVHLLMMVYAFDALAAEAKKNFLIGQLLDQPQIQKSGGLRFLIIPASNLATRDVRGGVNNRLHSEVDIMIYENNEAPTGEGRFCVAIMSQKQDFIDGMNALAAALADMDDAPDTFHHFDNFEVYVNSPTFLKYEAVIAAAMEHLKLKPDCNPQDLANANMVHPDDPEEDENEPVDDDE